MYVLVWFMNDEADEGDEDAGSDDPVFVGVCHDREAALSLLPDILDESGAAFGEEPVDWDRERHPLKLLEVHDRAEIDEPMAQHHEEWDVVANMSKDGGEEEEFTGYTLYGFRPKTH